MKGELVISCEDVYRNDNIICLYQQSFQSADSESSSSFGDKLSVARPTLPENVSGVCKVSAYDIEYDTVYS